MKLECVVLMEKRRIHIFDKEDTVDVFEEFTEEETYEDAIKRCGYVIDQLNVKVVGTHTKEEKKGSSEFMDFLPKTVNEEERCTGAHKYIETYVQHFKEVDESRFIIVSTNPSIMKDYAISKSNYPEGIDFHITAPNDLHSKIVDIFDSMVEDLDMVTDDVAVLRLDLK